MNTQIFSLADVSTQKTAFTLKNLWENALLGDLPCAVWQLPNTQKTHFLADFRENITPCFLDLEQGKKGFAISPFLNPNVEKTYFIQADLYWNTDMNVEIGQEFVEKITHFFIQNKTTKKDTKTNKKNIFLSKLPNKNTINPTENHYKAIVTKAVTDMQARKYDKVVLSRQKWVDYPHKDFEVMDFFNDLKTAYPNAFCYLFYLPNVGIWAGATPELLLETDQKHTFKTVALAGTQAYNTQTPANEVQWGQKEIEEQAMVSRYIINCFKKIRLREFFELGPKTVQAGNLLHLKTFFSVDMQATNFPNLATVMLPLLHPTSAVCGMPKAESMAFILENEGYERDFYTGFLGAINIEDSNQLFVNLRCMQFFQEKICLYVGAGITENSLPEKEWHETEIKSQTLLNVLQKK